MKTTMLVPLGIIAGLTLAGDAAAVDMPPLAQKVGCTACHAIDHKIVGPAWMDVSRKYKGKKGVAAKLVAKVKTGGSGVWGEVAMPPQAAPEADVKQLVQFILGLAKK